jgi:hypothetical protein
MMLVNRLRQGVPVSQSSRLVSAPGNIATATKRRSTRIEKSVPLIVLGTNQMGQPFMERTTSVSLSKHGCRYPSRHDHGVGTWVTLQVVGLLGSEEKTVSVRALVRSVHRPESLRELPQVGVELETPKNVWGIAQAPADWQSDSETYSSTTELEEVIVPAQEVTTKKESISEIPAKRETKMAEVTNFPSPSPVAARPAAAPKAAEAATPHRVVVTPDGLIAALHGKLQQEAEKAVQAAVAKQASDLVREALKSIEDARRSSLQEVETAVKSAVNSSLEEFRHGVDLYVNRAFGETKDHVVAALCSLDEESHTICNARRQALESELTGSVERAKEQFRKGMKSFVESFLTATVAAVEEDSKAAIEAQRKDHGKEMLHEGRSI